MYKYSKVMSTPGFDGISTRSLEPGHRKQAQAEKLSETDLLDRRILEFIRARLGEFDDDSYTYALVVPLGADESWEETSNGDAFLREDIAPDRDDWGHKTFETLSNAYMHHKNKDPMRGFGKIMYSVFNPEMDRVEAIWKLDNEKAHNVGSWDFVKAIRTNMPANISMGTHVPFDVCSVCGNAAHNVSEYCSHPKDPGFGKITPEGIKIRVFNPAPKFFDLSGVTVNAAYEAAVLGLLDREFRELAGRVKQSSGSARSLPFVPSAVLGEVMYHGGMGKLSSKHVSTVKVSDLMKEIPMLSAEIIQPMQNGEEVLSFGSIGMEGPSDFYKLLNTLSGLGIVLSPLEFTDAAHECGICEGPTDIMPDEVVSILPFTSPLGGMHPRGFDPVLADYLKDVVPKRSVLFPAMASRAKRELADSRGSKPRREEGPPRVSIKVRVDGVPAAASYAGYIKYLSQNLAAHLSEIIRNHPQLPSLLGGKGIKTTTKGSKAMLLPFSYIASRAGIKDPSTVVSMLEKNSSFYTAPYLGGSI